MTTADRRAKQALADLASVAAGDSPARFDGGTGPLFTEPILVVNQKAKLVEIHTEYAIFDQRGTQIGAVREVGLNAAKKVLRAFTKLDTLLDHTYQIVDMSGSPVLMLRHPSEPFRAHIRIEDGQGQEVGHIIQEKVAGKIRFRLKASGHGSVGTIDAENWRGWDFAIHDERGSQVARITKTWEGLAKAYFTTADNYVVQIADGVGEPLRSLVVAAAVAVDSARKQVER